MIKPEFSTLNIFLNIILSIMSHFIPKKKNSILLGSGRGGLFKGNPKYFFLYLINNKPEISTNWITDNIKVYYYLTSINKPVVYKYSIQGFWKILRSKIIIIDFSMKDFSYMGTLLGRFYIVQTWHGIALKYIALKEFEYFNNNDNLKLADKLFSLLKKYFQTREYESYQFIIAGSKTESENLQISFNTRKIKITGFPRNDILFNKGLLLNDLKRMLKKDSYNSVILYAPTFRDIPGLSKPFSENFLNKLNKELIKNNYLMIIKKHPHDTDLTVPSTLSNIIDISISTDDIQELLVYTDMLITDYSSVFFDFILTEKPVIYYIYDLETYLKNSRGMYFNFLTEIPGPFAKSEDELLNLIKTHKKWFSNKEYNIKYSKFVNKFHFYKDGNSCERMYESIKSYL